MAHSFLENQDAVLKAIAEINPNSILDIGVGAGDYGPIIKARFPNLNLDGIEIFEDYRNDQWNHYRDIKIADMRTFKYPKYDLYLMVDVLEHISKADADKLLAKLKGNILISVPVGYVQPEKLAPYDKHLHEYSFDDFPEAEKDFSTKLSKIVWLKQ